MHADTDRYIIIEEPAILIRKESILEFVTLEELLEAAILRAAFPARKADRNKLLKQCDILQQLLKEIGD